MDTWFTWTLDVVNPRLPMTSPHLVIVPVHAIVIPTGTRRIPQRLHQLPVTLLSHRTTTHLSRRRRRSEQRRQLRDALAVAYVTSDMTASPDHEPILERLDEALERLSIMSSWKSKTLVGTVIVLAFLGRARFWPVPDSESPNNAPPMQSPAIPPSPSPEIVSAAASPAVVGRQLSRPLTEDELDLARRQLRDALALPLPKNGMMWPEPRVLEALERFGNRSDAAFAVLREVIEEPPKVTEALDSPEAFARDLVHSRALLALGTLDRDLPGLLPYLWEQHRTGSIGHQFDSFMSLKRLGFQASDAPALVETLTKANTTSLALTTQLTQAVRDLGLAHPEALTPFTSAILGLLDHPESRIQLRAAATLIGWPEGNDPRVVDRLRSALGASDFEALVAIAALKAGGEHAQALVPDLLRYAETAEDRRRRSQVLRAVAHIRPDLAETHPGMAAEQARAAESEHIRSRMQSPTRTFEDLVAGLRDPASAVSAASSLADWGPSAIDTLPGMRAALAGMDEDSRDRIVEAMRRIDAGIQVEQVPSETVFSGVVHATSAMTENNSDAASRRANQRLEEYQMFRSWRTPEELVSLVRQLAIDANPVAEAFLRGIAEKDPELAARLRRAATGSNR